MSHLGGRSDADRQYARRRRRSHGPLAASCPDARGALPTLRIIHALGFRRETHLRVATVVNMTADRSSKILADLRHCLQFFWSTAAGP
ncbi:hypothetical protein THIOKS12320024 [Thiocapsa sp. KS1]|nr:hypothetical protein THIOKS12320024 [Thiocapsa sp. KS1]